MKNSWRIARIMGINIGLDASWFIILFLLIYSLGFVQFPRELHPRTFFPRVDAISIILGVAASLLLFASVLAHELSHAWMAQRRGIPVLSITLFIFGGVAQIGDEPDRPATEFLIAIMGPLMSVALALIFGAAWVWLRVINAASLAGLSLTPFILLTGLLFQANGALALFNLAPGFPLDGGRVFRAILWGVWHDIRRATLWATRAGQFVALILIGAGAWLFLRGFDLNGIWYALIGFFVWNAAREGYRQTLLRESLRGVLVSQLMTRAFETVAPNLTVAEFVERHLIPQRDQTFAVTDGGDLQGTLSFENIKRIPRAQWPLRRVSDVMTPRSALETLAPNQTAATALARFSRADEAELPVMDNGRLVGFLGRAELARYLHLRPY